jgi:hypothetical protein
MVESRAYYGILRSSPIEDTVLDIVTSKFLAQYGAPGIV